MPRSKRIYTGGLVYHVLNRSVGRATIFHDAADYAAFEDLLLSAGELTSVRLLTLCLMPNHWHLVLWPPAGGDLSGCMHRQTMTHTMRWHHAHGTLGTGPPQAFCGRTRLLNRRHSLPSPHFPGGLPAGR